MRSLHVLGTLSSVFVFALVASTGCSRGRAEAAAGDSSRDVPRPKIAPGQAIPREFIDKNDVAGVRYCLDERAAIDAEVALGATALHIAIAMRAAEVFDLLLDRGADLNRASKGGETPLMSCVVVRNERFAKKLLDRGAKLKADATEGRSVLGLAAMMGSNDWVELFLDRGVDVNEQDRRGYTALHRACQQRRAATVRLLLERGAKPEVLAQDDRSPLLEAAGAGNLECVRMLVAKKADVNRATKSNQETPLMAAVQSRRVEVVKFLLENGADRSAQDREGHRAIDSAKRSGNVELVELLE